MKKIIIAALALVAFAACKKDPEVIERIVEVQVEQEDIFTGSCFINDTLYAVRPNGTKVPQSANGGICFLQDSAKMDLAIAKGYFGYSYDGDTLYLFGIGSNLNSFSVPVQWINEDDVILSFIYSGNLYKGRFRRK